MKKIARTTSKITAVTLMITSLVGCGTNAAKVEFSDLSKYPGSSNVYEYETEKGIQISTEPSKEGHTEMITEPSSKETSNTGALKADFDPIIIILGTSYQIPCKYKDIKSLLEVDKENNEYLVRYDGTSVESGGDIYPVNLKSKISSFKDLDITTGFNNKGTFKVDVLKDNIDELEVFALGFENRSAQNNNYDISIQGLNSKVTFGSTESEVEKALGEPSNSWYSDSGEYAYYEYRSDDYSYYLDITISKSKGVVEIEMRYY